LIEQATRYAADGPAARGVAETQCLDFHSPYGCSKGAADQYVLDYARSYGLPASVFPHELHLRPASARYGRTRAGLRHFALRAAAGMPIQYLRRRASRCAMSCSSRI